MPINLNHEHQHNHRNRYLHNKHPQLPFHIETASTKNHNFQSDQSDQQQQQQQRSDIAQRNRNERKVVTQLFHDHVHSVHRSHSTHRYPQNSHNSHNLQSIESVSASPIRTVAAAAAFTTRRPIVTGRTVTADTKTPTNPTINKLYHTNNNVRKQFVHKYSNSSPKSSDPYRHRHRHHHGDYQSLVVAPKYADKTATTNLSKNWHHHRQSQYSI